MESNTVTITSGGKSASFVVGSENKQVKTIGEITYSPALEEGAEDPIYVKLAKQFRAKLVD